MSRDGHGKSRNGPGKVMEYFCWKVGGNPKKNEVNHNFAVRPSWELVVVPQWFPFVFRPCIYNSLPIMTSHFMCLLIGEQQANIICRHFASCLHKEDCSVCEAVREGSGPLGVNLVGASADCL